MRFAEHCFSRGRITNPWNPFVLLVVGRWKLLSSGLKSVDVFHGRLRRAAVSLGTLHPARASLSTLIKMATSVRGLLRHVEQRSCDSRVPNPRGA